MTIESTPAPVAPDSAPPSGDAGASQLQQDRAAAAGDVTTLSAAVERLNREISEARTSRDSTETERRELQADRDRVKGELEKRTQAAAELDKSWRDFAKRHISPERWAEIEKAEETRTGRQVLDRAARADSLDVVADVLEKDPGFGRFLRKQVSLGTRVTKETLPDLRGLYDEVRGPGATENGQQTSQAAPTAAAGAPATTPTPPRVPGIGAPSNDPGPVFTPGKQNNLLGRYFQKKK